MIDKKEDRMRIKEIKNSHQKDFYKKKDMTIRVLGNCFGILSFLGIHQIFSHFWTYSKVKKFKRGLGICSSHFFY